MYKSLKLLEQILGSSPMEGIREEKQNKDYEGFSFKINNQSFRSRLAKKTPKKKGYFVAFWEKNADNKNQAYPYVKFLDKLIIVIIDGKNRGLFVFPRSILRDKKILKTENQKGKMAIRVYPTWELNLNDRAKKTQKWQKEYFIDSSTLDNLDKINIF